MAINYNNNFLKDNLKSEKMLHFIVNIKLMTSVTLLSHWNVRLITQKYLETQKDRNKKNTECSLCNWINII